MVKSGVTSLKIEGRLKTPEYVANVTQVYPKALDKIATINLETLQTKSLQLVSNGNKDKYNLEMVFSHGLYTGWFEGINNQELVHARFAKERGVYLGEVTRVRNQQITVKLAAPGKPGDGVVFDCEHPEMREEGGRIYGVVEEGNEVILTFGRDDLDL